MTCNCAPRDAARSDFQPHIDAINPAPETTLPAGGSQAHLRVLLVDDVAMNRRVAELFR